MLSLLLIWTYSFGCLFVVSIIQRGYNWLTLHLQGDLTVQAREEVSALMRRFQRGETIPPREGVSWLRRLDDKLRGIYAAVTCRRSSDVALPPPAHRPPRPSVQHSEPRPSVHRSEPRPFVHRAEPHPSQPGRSSWHEPPPSQPGSSSWHEPPPSQLGSAYWHQQMNLGNTTHYILLNSVVIVLAFSAVTDAYWWCFVHAFVLILLYRRRQPVATVHAFRAVTDP